MGWDGIVSTASIDVVPEHWAPLPLQLTSLDSGLQDTMTLGDPGTVNPDTHAQGSTPPGIGGMCSCRRP